jgi:hypothetical protein
LNVELALDSMSERDSVTRLYGIPQRSTTGKPQAKIESQSGKAKVAMSDDIVDGKIHINNVESNRLTTYPSRLLLNMQDSDASVTTSTAKDSDDITTSNNDLVHHHGRWYKSEEEHVRLVGMRD